ncbi:MAG: pilin [Pseudoxanthomonas sp.]|nr:pilin [Pseudoxanthomonas sp.]
MKSPAYIFVALLLAVLFSLVAYRVSVHYAQVPAAGTEPVTRAPAPTPDPAAPRPVARPVEQKQAADAIARAAGIKAAVQSYFEANQTWPRNLAELSLGNPDQYADTAVAAISIQPQGVVAIAMKPHVARGGVIRLVPTVQPDGSVAWQCRATNYPAATRLPDCR